MLDSTPSPLPEDVSVSDDVQMPDRVVVTTGDTHLPARPAKTEQAKPVPAHAEQCQPGSSTRSGDPAVEDAQFELAMAIAGDFQQHDGMGRMLAAVSVRAAQGPPANVG